MSVSVSYSTRSCLECSELDTIDMVQCDECDKWAHYQCVGVGPEIEKVEWSCSIDVTM